MTVNDAIHEIHKIKDAIDTLDRYGSGEIGSIAKQHIDEIRQMMEHYMDMITELKIAK